MMIWFSRDSATSGRAILTRASRSRASGSRTARRMTSFCALASARCAAWACSDCACCCISASLRRRSSSSSASSIDITILVLGEAGDLRLDLLADLVGRVVEELAALGGHAAPLALHGLDEAGLLQLLEAL